MDKLYNEYEICKSDKFDFEDMVDRLSKEMEVRIETLKEKHAEALNDKDAQIRGMYTKVRYSWKYYSMIGLEYLAKVWLA